MYKLIFLFGFVVFFNLGCSSEKESDSSSENSEISTEQEAQEIKSVDDMIKQDQERIDSMKAALLEKTED
ncbi:MAG: hypothetical protein COA58_07590 [Bacteroidetes bacterium]|nr:MAG: hypothetical protein COA58_07590 [Bacteroidota bacterium]